MLLGGQPLCRGVGLQKDFQTVPPFPILRQPVPSSWRWAPLSSFTTCQLRRRSITSKSPSTTSRQTYCGSLCPPAPVTNSAGALGLFPMSPPCSAVREGKGYSALLLTPQQGFCGGFPQHINLLKMEKRSKNGGYWAKKPRLDVSPSSLWPILFRHRCRLEVVNPCPGLCSHPPTWCWASSWAVAPRGSGSHRGPSKAQSSCRMGQLGARCARSGVKKGLHTPGSHKSPDSPHA